ncbi:hypothetical protein AGMMS49546_39310 [Spirochaetia bacterium]|nr:hypothetical protein AGMMS49546_39310 [Spirochaetia bacterium]
MTGNATANIGTSGLQNEIPLYQPWQVSRAGGFDVDRQPNSQNFNSKWFMPNRDIPYGPATQPPSNILSFLKLDGLNLLIDDAKLRYKRLNGEDIDDSFAKRIYDVLCDSFLFVSVSRITFFKNRLKVRIIFNRWEYRINYDASDPDCIFIITEKDDITVVDECIPEDLVKTLGKF